VPLLSLYPLSLIFSIKSKHTIFSLLSLIFTALLIFWEQWDLVPFSLILSLSMALCIALYFGEGSVGGKVSHFGLLVFILGVSFNHFLYYEKEVSLKIGEESFLRGNKISLQKVKIIKNERYKAEIMDLQWGENNFCLERRYYHRYEIMRPKTAFALGFFDSYYAYILDRENINKEQKWLLKFQYHPLISWIWIGGILMALGGFLSIYAKKIRNLKKTIDFV
jgi:cytochrome c-type biogenesis protein CcmF